MVSINYQRNRNHQREKKNNFYQKATEIMTQTANGDL